MMFSYKDNYMIVVNVDYTHSTNHTQYIYLEVKTNGDFKKNAVQHSFIFH